MSGGAPTPQDNSVQLQQNQFAREDAQREQARQDKAAADTAARERFTTNLGSATAAARGSAASTLAQRHLDPAEFNPLIEAEIARTASSVPDLAESPGTYFGPDLADTVLNREQDARRTRYTNTLNQTFSPSYANTQFSDTSDDPFLADILNTQYGSAQSAVERARSRGTLNDQGYNASINRLTGAKEAGNAKLQDLGGTVISRNRQALTDIADRGRAGANAYTLGSTYDPGVYTNEASSKLSDLQGRFEGDVRGAAAGQDLFDLGDIIGFGAREQGAQNNPSNGLAEVLAQREQARRSSRGVGSTGSF